MSDTMDSMQDSKGQNDNEMKVEMVQKCAHGGDHHDNSCNKQNGQANGNAEKLESEPAETKRGDDKQNEQAEEKPTSPDSEAPEKHVDVVD